MMTTQLQVQAEPFEAYSEAFAELESEGRFRSRRGGSPQLSGRRSFSGSLLGGSRLASMRTRGRMSSTRAFPAGKRRRRLVRRGGGARWIGWAQQCLQQVIGRSVPQSGILGSATRRAIRLFQQRGQLPVTGLFDEATEAALRAACGGQVSVGSPSLAPQARPPTEDAEPVAGPEAPPPADGGADSADGGGGEPDGEPANGDDGELSFESHEGETEQEFMVSDACKVRIRRYEAIAITEGTHLKAPRVPGIYIIHVAGKPWYVGVAERTIYERFQQRMKVLNDFRIPSSALDNKSVAWVSIKSGEFPFCSIGRRPERDTAAKYSPLKGVFAVLKILEQYFIKTLAPSGNKRVESVRFAPGGSLTIYETGKDSIKLTGNSLLRDRQK
jgi:hypothetical protein